MMPMVFCASLPPCPRLYAPAETSCSRRNHLSTLEGRVDLNRLDTSTIISEPRRKPRVGEMKMKITVFQMPVATSAPAPAFAMTAPQMPPISACEELLGMPYHQVITFQVMAPTRAPNTTWVSTTPG